MNDWTKEIDNVEDLKTLLNSLLDYQADFLNALADRVTAIEAANKEKEAE